MSVPATTVPTRSLQIDFLYLDLDTCTRCRATDATLLEALERTQARALGFVSSPTIRINGVDIAGELVESRGAQGQLVYGDLEPRSEVPPAAPIRWRYARRSDG